MCIGSLRRLLREQRSTGSALEPRFRHRYSSPSYLKRFPLDTLKSDKSFRARRCTDPDHAAITQASIRMAQSLELRVIAEGVGTEEQLTVLLSNGCPSPGDTSGKH